MRALARMTEKGADSVGYLGRQKMLETAGARFHRYHLHIEDVDEQSLGEPVTPYDTLAARTAALGEAADVAIALQKTVGHHLLEHAGIDFFPLVTGDDTLVGRFCSFFLENPDHLENLINRIVETRHGIIHTGDLR
jgi:hypothetical protein